MTWAVVGFLAAGGGLTLIGTIVGAYLSEWLRRGAERKRRQEDLELSAIDDTRRQILDAADFLGAWAVGNGKRLEEVNDRVGSTEYRRADMLLVGDLDVLERMSTEFARVTEAGFGGSRSPHQLSNWGRLTAEIREALRAQERLIVAGKKIREIDTDPIDQYKN